MIKKIFILFKLARKLALSDVLTIADKFHKSPSIYENLTTKNSPFLNILKHKKLLPILNDILNDNFKFHMMKVNNKQKFTGKDIEYHQEYYYQLS